MMNNDDVPAIRMDEVSVLFGERAALDEITMNFENGGTTAVIGASGSGKSLLLKCAAGLVMPDSGKVFFNGKAIRSMGEREYQLMQGRTGFHFQDAALWANKSIKENLSLPILAFDPDMPQRLVDLRVTDAMASVNLDVDPDSRPASISMGLQKIVSFLRATITRPEILFLDDSLSFLDHGTSRLIVQKIEEFRDTGVTIVMSTHDRILTGRLADRVAVLHEGRLIASGRYDDVMNSEDPALIPILRELI